MNTKKIKEEFIQSQYAEQIVQKMNLIKGDTEMKRNFEENISFLNMLIEELTLKIAKGHVNGEITEGFDKLISECKIWIDLILKARNSLE